MKKTVQIKDPVSKQKITFVMSDEPLESIDLLENSIKGYITSLKEKEDFTPDTQLTRAMSLSIAKTALPDRYTTTVEN